MIKNINSLKKVIFLVAVFTVPSAFADPLYFELAVKTYQIYPQKGQIVVELSNTESVEVMYERPSNKIDKMPLNKIVSYIQKNPQLTFNLMLGTPFYFTAGKCHYDAAANKLVFTTKINSLKTEKSGGQSMLVTGG